MPGAGDYLEDFLMTTLQRAIALAKVDGVAVLVGKDLQFDVARTGYEFLDEHTSVAE